MGVFNSLPLVIFSYMYQTNIPMIYSELKKKNMRSMKKIMGYGTAGATIAYLMAGIFGYATFAQYPVPGYPDKYPYNATVSDIMNV